MCSGVFVQVIGASEALVAGRAHESFLSGMRSQMALQFVGTRESFAAEKPVAHERPFTGVPAQVSLQVRRLGIDLDNQIAA